MLLSKALLIKNILEGAIMIDAAIQRRDILKAEYAKLGLLIIIQLPNDETVETS